MTKIHTKTVAQVESLWIYPIKSCRGISIQTMQIDKLGPLYDRNWMIVDQNGVFVTQRKFPKMARIETFLLKDMLTITIDGFGQENVTFIDSQKLKAEMQSVKIWQDEVTAINGTTRVDALLSDFLKSPVKLVQIDKHNPRLRQKEDIEFTVGFADSRPFLLTNIASHEDLSNRVGEDIPISRFRPNIVIKNQSAYSEDEWESLKIGNIEFRQSVACDRCIIPTVDQKTGEKTGAEPLKTLKSYRLHSKSIVFGRRLVHKNPGLIQIGDLVKAHE
ncbi:MAG: MOSC N-terminal beta barrel domain-containing protein [Bdellovibrionota bacterium]